MQLLCTCSTQRADHKYLMMWLRPDISCCCYLQARDQPQEGLDHHCSGGWSTF
jgi:hypothetical protein